jgi:FkbM family methyltransferase
MSFISYAQNCEDVILRRALRDVEKGFYIDVGAGDPEEWSVTRSFYDRGWSGINIEPLDAYFRRLNQARPHDTNLRIAIGREAGLRTLHAILGAGLSTLSGIGTRHQAAGWQAHEAVVPVLTLTKVLEDRAAPTIHFLRIGVQGAEIEVVEGLDLERFRPWIIIIEATEPFSTVNSRDKWEHLITGQRYSFAYFDGFNCFYVAEEVSKLKERLSVPPNVSDDFVRFRDWSNRKKAETLQRELAGLRRQARGLEEAFRAEQARTANLTNAVQKEQAHAGRRLERIQQLETELAVRYHYRGVFGSLHEMGDRMTGGGLRSLAKRTRVLGDQLTGGGLRSLAKRLLATLIRWAMGQRALLTMGQTVLKPFPRLATSFYQLAAAPDPVTLPPPSSQPDGSSDGQLSSDGSAVPPDLSASAWSTGSRPVTAARIECRKPPVVQNETALFVTHSTNGYLKPHVKGYLRALAREGIGVVLIVAADEEFIEDGPELTELDGLLIRNNEGFDFAAWAHALRLHRELYRAETLYLLNDSVIGPVNDAAFHSTVARLRITQADVVGMTENYERGWHIQSYFLALKQGALRSYAWHKFVLNVVSFENKEDVINNYEIKLAPTLVAAGLTALVLFEGKFDRDPTVFHWRELLDEGFPFIKIKTLRDEIPGVNRGAWREALDKLGFETSVVDQVLAGSVVEKPLGAKVQLWRTASAAPLTPRRPPRLVFIGPWNYDNGLGVAARGYLSALMRAGFATNFQPITRPFHVHQRTGPTIECRNFVDCPDIVIVHANPDGWDGLLTESQLDTIRDAPFRIGAFIWESPELPSVFRRRFHEIDAVWAPTTYCREIFRSATGLPVHTVHFAVAARECRRGPSEIAEVKEWLDLKREDKVILFALDASSSLARKNPFALVAAFKKTNLAETGWRLILKVKHSSDDWTGAEALRTKVQGCAGAHLIDRPMGNEAMSALMEAADIYASPHSSEGFGLTIAEAMALGKVVVATDYGGSRDFLNQETGFPVRWHAWEIDRDEGAYARGTVWAKVDEEHLAESLIAAATLPDQERQRISECARQRIRDTLSPEAVAAEMQASIDSLLAT